ncbi:Hypothetical_protein [Hexamita inflata]|uniref:Hypothetical_protein n=1 Tax=Hexamita inflata TaxID=28002 RepID=A0AA86PTI7_9EUKA|nr:Hypothetical protein HINF_LOCUS32186 [Hexamita inflata]
MIGTQSINITNFATIGQLAGNSCIATLKDNQININMLSEALNGIQQNIAGLIGYTNNCNVSISSSSFHNSVIFASTNIGAICGQVLFTNISMFNININNQSLNVSTKKYSQTANLIAKICNVTAQIDNIQINISVIVINNGQMAFGSGLIANTINSSVCIHNNNIFNQQIVSNSEQQSISASIIAYLQYSELRIENSNQNQINIVSNCNSYEAVSSTSVVIGIFSTIIIQSMVLSNGNITANGTYSRAGGIIGKIYDGTTYLRNISVEQTSVLSITTKQDQKSENSLTSGIIAHIKTQIISIIDCNVVNSIIITTAYFDAITAGVVALSRDSKITINNININYTSIQSITNTSLSYSSGFIALFDNLGLIDKYQLLNLSNIVISYSNISSISEIASWAGGISAVIQNVSANIKNVNIQFQKVESSGNYSSFGGIIGKSTNSNSIFTNIQFENNYLVAQVNSFVHVGGYIGYINCSNIDVIGSSAKNTNISLNYIDYSMAGGFFGVIQVSNVSVIKVLISEIVINVSGGNLSYSGSIIGSIGSIVQNTVNITNVHVESILMKTSSQNIYQHMISQSSLPNIIVSKSYSTGFSYMNDANVMNCPLFTGSNSKIGC